MPKPKTLTTYRRETDQRTYSNLNKCFGEVTQKNEKSLHDSDHLNSAKMATKDTKNPMAADIRTGSSVNAEDGEAASGIGMEPNTVG